MNTLTADDYAWAAGMAKRETRTLQRALALLRDRSPACIGEWLERRIARLQVREQRFLRACGNAPEEPQS